MYVTKKIIFRMVVSLFAGMASTIGMRAGGVIWDGCIGDKFTKGT